MNIPFVVSCTSMTYSSQYIAALDKYKIKTQFVDLL